MKTVYTVKANHKMVAPGVWAFDAEAMVTGPDVDEEVYVAVSEYDGATNLTVGNKSIMEDDGGAESSVEENRALWESVQKWMDSGCPAPDGDAADGDEFAEHYSSLAAAKKSAYYPVFKMLVDLLDEMSVEV